MTENGEITISLSVKNTGDRSGIETVQLYVQDVTASVARPIKELRGYSKVELNPGEEKSITFRITIDDLKFHTLSGKYEAEKGLFRVYVGNSSAINEYKEFRLV